MLRRGTSLFARHFSSSKLFRSHQTQISKGFESLNKFDFKSALGTFEQVLNEAKETQAQDQEAAIAAADALHSLGCAHFQQSEFKKAEQYQRDALAMRLSVISLGMGDDQHAGVGSTLNDLAAVCIHRGLFSECETLLRRANYHATRAYKPNETLIAFLHNTEGVLLTESAMFDDAERHFDMSIQKLEDSEDPEAAVALAKVMANKAVLGRLTEKYEAGMGMMDEAQTMMRGEVGTDHPDFLRCLSALATFPPPIILNGGERCPASEMLSGVISGLEPILGSQHYEVALAKFNLALLQGTDIYEAFETFRATVGAQHPTSLQLHTLLYEPEPDPVRQFLSNGLPLPAGMKLPSLSPTTAAGMLLDNTAEELQGKLEPLTTRAKLPKDTLDRNQKLFVNSLFLLSYPAHKVNYEPSKWSKGETNAASN